MAAIPKRFSLVASVVDSLRQSITEGEWKDFLPGERQLCVQLQISRSTLKAALVALQREGLIEIAHGKPTRILRATGSVPRRSRIVAGLFIDPIDDLNSSAPLWLTQLQFHLHRADYELRLYKDEMLRDRFATGRLQKIVYDANAACWMLSSVKREIQEWFMRNNLPTLILGSPNTGIRLPAIDIHYEAIARHAVGKLFALGHRHIGLVLSGQKHGGELACERGFTQAFHAQPPADAKPLLLFHDSTIEGVRRALDSALQKSPRPTALIVNGADFSITTVGHLQQAGLRVPNVLSVISLDFTPVLTAHVPPISCYELDRQQFGERISRLVVELARTGVLPLTPKWVMPDWREGGTVARCAH